MVQNILFDLDETLLDFKRSESRALSNMLRHIGVEPTEKVISRYSEINKSRWKLLEQGLLTRQQVKESRYEILLQSWELTTLLRRRQPTMRISSARRDLYSLIR